MSRKDMLECLAVFIFQCEKEKKRKRKTHTQAHPAKIFKVDANEDYQSENLANESWHLDPVVVDVDSHNQTCLHLLMALHVHGDDNRDVLGENV